ncbi:UPF0223 family protein [Ornithinibacillus sp. BX22]|uniref:UPF0223 protein H8S33_03205 n=2 Tax=Ornithinibacillus TaxID=484508 RepID=A0A923RIP6_9BACI|nr:MULTISPECIES: UPF0223 family protein [Ornithinibacillus]MBC5635827.1 UPF0223 family protein [Ornithinibacillus hominis]MBS3680184.1 UPF0223 family protein [Ornithinibacillus massiliensis]
MNYTYPFDTSWSKEEIIDVVQFFSLIERAYEKGIDRDILLAGYRKFKHIVPAKSEEKRYFQEFEKDSGYSCYQVVKMARDSESGLIKMR